LGDYPGFDSRNKIIDEIKDFIGELNGTIGKHITLTYYVIALCQMQARAFVVVRCRSLLIPLFTREHKIRGEKACDCPED